MESIAIVGIGCELPDAQTPEELWQNLINEHRSIRPATSEDWGFDPNTLYHPEKGLADKTCNTQGAWVSDKHISLDRYALPEEWLEGLGKPFKLALHCADKALVDARSRLQDRTKLDRCGMVLGAYSWTTTKQSTAAVDDLYREVIQAGLGTKKNSATSMFGKQNNCHPSHAGHNCMMSGYLAASVASALSLEGPSYSIDAACASSLYAIRLAAMHLATGNVDTMLAGGVSAYDPLFSTLGFSVLHAMPAKNADSHPFCKSSDGLAVGEGACLFVLKRLSDALLAKDAIYGIVPAVGLSNDGGSRHMLNPSPKGQTLAINRAYQSTDIDKSEIAYIECHATGTEVGDQVEVDTLAEAFAEQETKPLLGTVKSNVGHLLTAAGAVGLMKTLLSMEKGKIPATPGITQPVTAQGKSSSIIVQSLQDWPENLEPEHKQSENKSAAVAAVNAFGFGGCNAHLLVQSPEALSEHEEIIKTKPRPRLAITGMEGIFGDWDGLSALSQNLYSGAQAFTDLPAKRWRSFEKHAASLSSLGLDQAPKGAYIEQFSVDFLRLKIPPEDLQKMNAQQLLMLRCADAAIQDAKLTAGSNVAVVIGMGMELSVHQLQHRWQSAANTFETNTVDIVRNEYECAKLLHSEPDSNTFLSYIGNLLASRIASLWDFNGPTFTLSAEENSAMQALELAALMLAEREVDAVVVGAVDLACGVENIYLREQRQAFARKGFSLSFAEDADGPIPAEGAGAIVLKRSGDAIADGERIYAHIDSISLVNDRHAGKVEKQQTPQSVSAKTISQAANDALSNAQLSPADIAYVEAHASGYSDENKSEIIGLSEVYSKDGANCVLGSVKSQVGHSFNASGIAAIIRTALCIHHQYLPGTPGWKKACQSLHELDSGFCVKTQSEPWFSQGLRRAAINHIGMDRSCAHIVLSQDCSLQKTSPTYQPLLKDSEQLFFITGRTHEEIIQALETFKDGINVKTDFRQLSINTIENITNSEHKVAQTYCLSLVAKNYAYLFEQIRLAELGLANLSESGSWQSPSGSYYTRSPLGELSDTGDKGEGKNEIVFVYPGMGNNALGMSKDLFALFPHLYARLKNDIPNVRQEYNLDFIYPRQLDQLSAYQKEIKETELFSQPTATLKLAAFYSLLHSWVLRDVFNIQPNLATGYSLGELSMMFALDAWPLDGEIIDRLASSKVLNERLGGSKKSLLDYFDRQDKQNTDVRDWTSYFLMVSESRAMEILGDYEDVFLSHVNSDNEVVIVGSDKRCRQVIEALKCDSFRMNTPLVIHCPPSVSETENVRAILQPKSVKKMPAIPVFSRQASEDNPEKYLEAIVAGFVSKVDFKQQIENAWQQGGRIFIEIGPGASCTRWVKDCLKDKAHVAQALYRRNQPEQAGLASLLAVLVSHRVNVDLNPWLLSLKSTVPVTNKRLRSVVLGGSDLYADIRDKLKPQVIPDKKPTAPSENKPFVHKTTDSETFQPKTKETSFAKKMQAYARTADSMHQQFLKLHQKQFELIFSQAGVMNRNCEDDTLNQSDLLEPHSMNSIGETVELAPVKTATPGKVIFDEADIMEFTEGRLASVFGKVYQEIDHYPSRIRLPSLPFMALSRVTRLNAELGSREACSIRTEYDVPHRSWYGIDGQVPYMAIDAQGVLLLLSYIGLDFEIKGERYFRWLNASITFLGEMPKEGDTIQYDIEITNFFKNGDQILYYADFHCSVDGRPVMRIDRCCAGFFSPEELSAGKGITDKHRSLRSHDKKTRYQFYECKKIAFTLEDIVALQKGQYGECFGASYVDSDNPSLRLPPGAMRMIDRIPFVEPEAGRAGLGIIHAEKDLQQHDWYLRSHFKDSPVFAGPCMIEGCIQLLQFYALYLGLDKKTKNARFQPYDKETLKVCFRGQVPGDAKLFSYRVEIIDMGLTPAPYLIADVDLIYQERVIGCLENLGLELK